MDCGSPDSIADLGLYIDVAGLIGDGKVRGINIDARGLEVFVKGRVLVNLASEMKPDVVI